MDGVKMTKFAKLLTFFLTTVFLTKTEHTKIFGTPSDCQFQFVLILVPNN